jgi:hypothetical protein
MKAETFKGQVESAYGKVLPKAVAFQGSFDAYESIQEIKAANDYPSDEEVINFRNAQRKANARAKATVEALDAAGHTKPAADDPQVLLQNMIKTLILSGKDKDTAISLAERVLGYPLEA